MPARKAHNRVDMAGLRVGRLTVVRPSSKSEGKKLFWECRCDCGKTVHIRASSLRRRRSTKSCGCGKREAVRAALWRGHEAISGCYWGKLKTGAEQRNLAFEVKIEYAWQLYLSQSGRCALSGVAIGFASNLKTQIDDQSASLDRIDSSHGYIPGNIQWVHKDINKMKQCFTQEDFIEWCKKVTNNSASGKSSSPQSAMTANPSAYASIVSGTTKSEPSQAA